jgi:hypothetical protein
LRSVIKTDDFNSFRMTTIYSFPDPHFDNPDSHP